MGGFNSTGLTEYSPEFADSLYGYVARAAAQPDVKFAVQANHDDNRWWPSHVQDWRVRMTVAGWSTRVSYAMIGTYAGVVDGIDNLGWSRLTTLDDQSLARLIRPIGLPTARVRYLRSLARFIDGGGISPADLAAVPLDDLIAGFAAGVDGAGYNTAQCAVLYARGYHCGVMPVDSGMVNKLAPLLGIALVSGVAAHEHMRRLLQAAVIDNADAYRDLASRFSYEVTLPPDTAPTWFVHLVLIYFKRLYLNRPTEDLCTKRPACPVLIGCSCQPARAGEWPRYQ
jgi:endonuclease III